ncbi:MAG: nucleotidyltransferase domain-containing protein [Gammaproteobacteria bacterium]|nr:nucleotidyltransferase domain-containing protein [Gammaproteobacteria bacterium]MBU1777342.1 nucleotidyltransferase domain-containing protein [Gammaproteobacteria bacterium]
MRISEEQIGIIRAEVARQLGTAATVRLFGSRADDTQRGGDIDLLVETSTNLVDPALTAARISARISRALYGRRIDVVLKAPNLKQLPIHEIAMQEGVIL